ncbi:MAG: hypothetical protein OQL28_08590 [Sedimenticola sp.]|nr:hypothetical protein [Sedimenticola sp.]
MRIALYFFAFTVLLAVLIPQLIGTILQPEDQLTRQLREGADPTVVLEETASGVPASDCPDTDFEYRITARGEPYVRALSGVYVAVLIDNKAEVFRLEPPGDVAVPATPAEIAEPAIGNLKQVLHNCISSDRPAKPATLQLKRE